MLLPSHTRLAIAAAIATCTALTSALVPRPNNECRQTRIAILGGGMAGITAAQTLHNNSISDFIIIEYQATLGGRIHDTTFGWQANGNPFHVEIGANWIQGIGKPGGKANPIWDLAKRYNLLTSTSDFDSLLTYNETGSVDYSDLIDKYSGTAKSLSRQASTIQDKNLPDETVRTGLTIAGWKPRKSDMAAQAAEYLGWDFENIYAPENCSLAFSIDTGGDDGSSFGPRNEFVIDQGGFRRIVEGEASEFLKPNDTRLLLNTKVTGVKYSSTGVTITNDDGSCISAEYAICTFSLGVLQRHNVIKFDPALPTWKQQAIQSFNFGTYTKLFMQFNETFWPNEQFFLYASPTARGHYAVWQSLSTEGFLEGSHILFATLTDQESYHAEEQTDEQTQAEAMKVLREMFPDRIIPEPTSFMYPRWTQMPWSYGSYTSWPAGTSEKVHSNLRANVDRLWFAGEALSRESMGYVHGAWFEGKDAGEQVAGLIQGRCVNGSKDTKTCNTREIFDKTSGTVADSAGSTGQTLQIPL